MTICVPQKPFVILAWGIIYSLIITWIPFLGFCIYNSVVHNNHVTWDLWALFWVPLMFTCIKLYDINTHRHWFQWCNTKKENVNC